MGKPRTVSLRSCVTSRTRYPLRSTYSATPELRRRLAFRTVRRVFKEDELSACYPPVVFVGVLVRIPDGSNRLHYRLVCLIMPAVPMTSAGKLLLHLVRKVRATVILRIQPGDLCNGL